MSLESGSFISQLNPANPPAGDPVANAADHLRLIKGILQSQFPNLGAVAVTPTAQQLSANLVPVGGIIMWSGSIASIPAGWTLCNGVTVSKLDGSGNITPPNLQDRFVIGAGNAYAVAATGGATTFSATSGSTGLTAAQIPSLTITISDPGHTHTVYDPGHNHLYQNQGTQTVSAGAGVAVASVGTTGTYTNSSVTGVYLGVATTGISASTSGTYGSGHSHTISGSTMSPYYALAFIMKY